MRVWRDVARDLGLDIERDRDDECDALPTAQVVSRVLMSRASSFVPC